MPQQAHSFHHHVVPHHGVHHEVPCHPHIRLSSLRGFWYETMFFGLQSSRRLQQSLTNVTAQVHLIADMYEQFGESY